VLRFCAIEGVHSGQIEVFQGLVLWFIAAKRVLTLSTQAILMLRIFYTDTPFIPPCLHIGHSLQIMEAMLLLFSYYKQYRSGCSFFFN